MGLTRKKVYALMALSFLLLVVFYFIFDAVDSREKMNVINFCDGFVSTLTPIINIIGFYGVFLKRKATWWLGFILLSLILQLILLQFDLFSLIWIYISQNMAVSGNRWGYTIYYSFVTEIELLLIIFLNAEILIRYKFKNEHTLSVLSE